MSHITNKIYVYLFVRIYYKAFPIITIPDSDAIVLSTKSTIKLLWLPLRLAYLKLVPMFSSSITHIQVWIFKLLPLHFHGLIRQSKNNCLWTVSHRVNALHVVLISKEVVILWKHHYLKNHWTKHRHVCTYSDLFYMLIPNADMKLRNCEIFDKFVWKRCFCTWQTSVCVWRVNAYC